MEEEISSLYVDKAESHINHEEDTSSRSQGEDIMAVVFKKLSLAPRVCALVLLSTHYLKLKLVGLSKLVVALLSAGNFSVCNRLRNSVVV